MKSLLPTFRPAPLPPEVERALAEEVHKGEVTVTSIRLLIAVLGLLALIPNWKDNSPATMYSTLGLTLAYALYTGLVLRLLWRGKPLSWTPYMTAAVDMLLVSGFSLTSLYNPSGAYETLLAPAYPILTLLFLTLTVLQYRVAVSAVAAGLAIVLRLSVLWWITGNNLVHVSSPALYGSEAISMSDQYTLLFFFFLAGLVASSIAYTSRRLVLRSAQETVHTQMLERAQAQYRRYLNGNVLDYVMSHPDAMGLGGRRRAATVMFVDIRNFTAYAESETPERVVEFLNTCFQEFVEVVFKYGGTLDKFLGDGLMAVFGVPREMEDAPVHALKAALEMQERVALLNSRRRPEAPELRIGIGIAHGIVIAGNIGSEQRMEFTVVGDTVNFAARLQALNKDFNTSIIVSESVAEATRHLVQLKQLPPVKIRGKQGEVNLWAIMESRVPDALLSPEILHRGPS